MKSLSTLSTPMVSPLTFTGTHMKEMFSLLISPLDLVLLRKEVLYLYQAL